MKRDFVWPIRYDQKGSMKEGGGLVLTADMWLTARIAAMRDVLDFDMRYAQQLYFSFLSGSLHLLHGQRREVSAEVHQIQFVQQHGFGLADIMFHFHL